MKLSSEHALTPCVEQRITDCGVQRSTPSPGGPGTCVTLSLVPGLTQTKGMGDPQGVAGMLESTVILSQLYPQRALL